MGDNIRLIYNLIHYLNYNNLHGLLICVDLEIAFDSVDWNFVMKVLKAFGFGPIICQWTYTFCVQAVKKYIKRLDIAVQSNRVAIFVQHFWLKFETFVNEKSINVTNMKLTEDFVLFGNSKDFESDEIFDFIILSAKCFHTQMENGK